MFTAVCEGQNIPVECCEGKKGKEKKSCIFSSSVFFLGLAQVTNTGEVYRVYYIMSNFGDLHVSLQWFLKFIHC